MEELKLYDIDSGELNELIDSKRIALKYNNLEYNKLTNKIEMITFDNFLKSPIPIFKYNFTPFSLFKFQIRIFLLEHIFINLST